MTEALHAAANTQFIDPAFMKKLVAVKDNLKAVAVAVQGAKMRNMAQHRLNYVRRSKWPKHADGLLTWIRFLLCSVLNYN